MFLLSHSCCFRSLYMCAVQMARGGMARMRAKRMRAVYLIMTRYKRYKLRSYITSLVRRFADVRRMQDYGKSVQWPPLSLFHQDTIGLMKKMHMRLDAELCVCGQFCRFALVFVGNISTFFSIFCLFVL